MSGLDDVGTRDGWRCWICDEPVDPEKSVNDGRGPSIDSYFTSSKSAKGAKTPAVERLAHRGCNTRKGAVTPVIAWPRDLLVADPAVLLTTVTRLERKPGREVVGRSPSRDDATNAADWLRDRLSRLTPGVKFSVSVEPGGGQQLLVLTNGRER